MTLRAWRWRRLEALVPEKVAKRPFTNREYALLLRHKEDRPWLVCVHGAEMGRAALDLMLFRAWHLHEDLGLNVVLPVLPMHGPRDEGCQKVRCSPART